MTSYDFDVISDAPVREKRPVPKPADNEQRAKLPRPPEKVPVQEDAA